MTTPKTPRSKGARPRKGAAAPSAAETPAAAKPARASRKGGGASATRGGPTLVVVESPTKAKTIGKYLGSGYEVKATVGHLIDLPTRELGVDVEHGFQPKYVIIKGKSKTLAEIKKAAKGAREVFLATDPDREGEAIAWHVAGQLGDRVPTRRVLFQEITKDAVQRAMAQPVDIDGNKVNAQQARRILDRLVGYKASPILWRTIKTGLSAGRVQTVALHLIVEREREIRKFTAREYWTIGAECAKDGQVFEATLKKLDGHTVDGDNALLPDEATAARVAAELGRLPFVVTSVEQKQRRKAPAAPFTTSTLQQEANKKLGFSTRRTMRAAQDLYEGIDVGVEGPVGLITYMRTDSVRVADSAVAAVRDFIGQHYGAPYLPERPNTYQGRKNANVQDAHEAVRPTDVRRRPEDVARFLSPDQAKVYQLIWQRFVASQMMPAVYDVTTVDFELGGGKYLVRATGSILKFDGFHRLYIESREAEEGKSMDDLSPIPPLAVGDRVEVRAITPEQHFTQPPPRFSEASLVKELERLGIGRPSTYSAIVSTLTAREYVKVESRRFFPTELGELVETLMLRLFPDIFEVHFTARMEEDLDRIDEGAATWQDVIGDFYAPFSRDLERVNIEALVREYLKVEDPGPCPKCGSPLEFKSGRFGPYFACVRYASKKERAERPAGSTCDYVKSLRADKVPDRPTDEKCHLCGSPMVIKTGRFGEFLACTTYPTCKGTRSIPLGIKCPKCTEGDLAERRSKRGKIFYGCLRYPACDYVAWNKLLVEPCPSCGFIGRERKVTKAEGDVRTCLKCGHKEVVAEPEEAALA
ncbi:MAG TPA: type I DNA topoisomerase [Gemmatimonadales bacterium]|nr:type I DNA topoisomerase [Gemmatimonadales bacterium]